MGLKTFSLLLLKSIIIKIRQIELLMLYYHFFKDLQIKNGSTNSKHPDSTLFIVFTDQNQPIKPQFFKSRPIVSLLGFYL